MAANQPETSNNLQLAEPLVQLRNLSKEFPIRKGVFNQQVGSVKAVTDISLDIFSGETLGVVGESGCGKSTLGRCILQLIRPTAGEVIYNGKNLSALPNKALRPLRKDLQIVFQNPYSSLNPRMTIGDILSEPLEIHKLAKGPALSQRVYQLLDMVGLPKDAFNRYPHEFSGGQRQRVGIARALALNPKFIVADEPVSALDVSVQAQILNLLQTLKHELGLTYLFIAHNLSVVEYISDRVMVMYLGQVVEIASVATLYKNPLHPYTQALMSAIPLPNPKLARQETNRIRLVGDLPNPANPPSGCRFHTRCPYAIEECKIQHPPAVESEPGHIAYCIRIPEIQKLQGSQQL